MKRTATSLLMALCIAGAAGAREIGPEALDRLPEVDVFFLGEIHDNPAQHRNQARAVRSIAPAALVFEMLGEAQIAALPDDRSDARAMAEATEWEARGWPDFAMYHPIFTAAPEARIYAGDPGIDAVRQSLRTGAAAVFGEEATRFGLTEPLPEAQQTAREADLQAAHCDALPPEALPGMVEAQRLRDAALARAALLALAETGGPVVVITGVEHARTDIGAPALLRRADPGVTVLSIAQIESIPTGRPPHHLWLFTEGVPTRGDPCAVFETQGG